MSFVSTMWTVFKKDLRIELRTREVTLSTFLFAFLVVLVAAFALDLHTAADAGSSSGVFWVAIAFAGVLALSRTFEREREFGVWQALSMTPTPPSAIYLGKALGVFFFLIVVEALLIPLIDLFFHASFLSHLLPLIPVFVLATLGYAACGTLFAAMTIRTRLRDLLLGVILYPLLAPLLISAQKATVTILGGDGLEGASDYINLLLILDAIYLVGGLWLFGPVMED